ncbi:MAG: hypothetical protein L6R48_16575 [Planctomycetes bacterium]|nr:hypothetical protein [Planctomycetota bacterium]
MPEALIPSVIGSLLSAASTALAGVVPRLGLSDCEAVVNALPPSGFQGFGPVGQAHVALADALARLRRPGDETAWKALVSSALAVDGSLDSAGQRTQSPEFLVESASVGSAMCADLVLAHWLLWHHRCDRLTSVPWTRIRLVLGAHPERLSRIMGGTPKAIQSQLADLELRSAATAGDTAASLRTAIRQGSLAELSVAQVAILLGRKESGIRTARRQFPAEVQFTRGRQRLFRAAELVRLLDAGFRLRAHSPVKRRVASPTTDASQAQQPGPRRKPHRRGTPPPP